MLTESKATNHFCCHQKDYWWCHAILNHIAMIYKSCWSKGKQNSYIFQFSSLDSDLGTFCFCVCGRASVRDLKEYYEIVGESRSLSGFFLTHADFVTEMHF